MGMKAMKESFSFSNLLTKNHAAKPIDRSSDHDRPIAQYDLASDTDSIESRPYSPTMSEMERPHVPSQLQHDLRQACAVLVAMTNPPDPEEEELADQLAIVRQFEAEQKTKSRAQQREAEARDRQAELRKQRHIAAARVESRPGALREHVVLNAGPQVQSEPALLLPRSQYRPSSSGQSQARLRNGPGHDSQVETISISLDPSHPEVRPLGHISTTKSIPLPVGNSSEGFIDSGQFVRPKNMPLADDVEHNRGVAYLSSHSTSRTTSDHAALRAGSPSTALTSLQPFTPKLEMDGRLSQQKGRSSSEEGSQASSTRDEVAELTRRRADEYAIACPNRPASRPGNPSRVNSSSDVRPASRAGSLASSIAGSISNYIRPRASKASLAGTQSGRDSSLETSRPESRSSMRSTFSSSSGWWRNGGLRKRGSWASFRSAGGPPGSRDNQSRSTKGDNSDGPNLNRPLPALPGLDQYKEVKTHIGQLISKKGKKKVKKNKISEPQPFIPLDTPYTATLPMQWRSGSNLGHYDIATTTPQELDGAKHLGTQGSVQENCSEEQAQSINQSIERRSTHPNELTSPGKNNMTLRPHIQRNKTSDVRNIHAGENSYFEHLRYSPDKALSPMLQPPPSLSVLANDFSRPKISQYPSMHSTQLPLSPSFSQISPKTTEPVFPVSGRQSSAHTPSSSVGESKGHPFGKAQRASLNLLKPRRQSSGKENNASLASMMAGAERYGFESDPERKKSTLTIRGPSYHKELEQGTFPRPMEVGSPNVYSAGAGGLGAAGMVVLDNSKAKKEFHSPSVRLKEGYANENLGHGGLGMSLGLSHASANTASMNSPSSRPQLSSQNVSINHDDYDIHPALRSRSPFIESAPLSHPSSTTNHNSNTRPKHRPLLPHQTTRQEIQTPFPLNNDDKLIDRAGNYASSSMNSSAPARTSKFEKERATPLTRSSGEPRSGLKRFWRSPSPIPTFSHSSSSTSTSHPSGVSPSSPNAVNALPTMTSSGIYSMPRRTGIVG